MQDSNKINIEKNSIRKCVYTRAATENQSTGLAQLLQYGRYPGQTPEN